MAQMHSEHIDPCTLRKYMEMHSLLAYILFAFSLFLIVQQSTSENQMVIVQRGDTATLRFNTSWPSTSSLEFVPYFTLRFKSMHRPFCVDGTIYLGLLHRSQYDRFTVVSQRNGDKFVVNLFIQDVDVNDKGSYVFTFRSGRQFDTEEVISLQVTVPPGKAECFILKDKETFWPKVHCRATAGSGNATISCFQNNVKVPYNGEAVRNGDMIRGIFWIISSNLLHCCSHEWKDDVTQGSCLDFVFPSQPKITRATFDTPESSKVSSTKEDHRSPEHVQEEPLTYRSFASREYPTVTPCIILASLIIYSQR